jgi:hypothetical protein
MNPAEAEPPGCQWQSAPKPASVPLTPELAGRAWQQYLAGVWQEADLLRGGFGEVSKFPIAPHLAALLQRQAPLLVARAAEEERHDWAGFLEQGRHWWRQQALATGPT